VLDNKQISPTITVAAGWQKIAYKSLLKPTEVTILMLNELRPLATVNLNPINANHQLRIIHTDDVTKANASDTLQTFGVTVGASGDEALKNGSKMPLNTLMTKLNQSSGLTFKSQPHCGLQVNAKVKTQSATFESSLFSMENIELVLTPTKEEFASSTNRAGNNSETASGKSAQLRESKPFELTAKTNQTESHSQAETKTLLSSIQSSSHSGLMTPEALQGSILSYSVLNNCVIILYHDTSCYRLLKMTA